VLGLTKQVNEALRAKGITVPIRVAVMGCVVNGPGEARPTSASPPARARASSWSRARSRERSRSTGSWRPWWKRPSASPLRRRRPRPPRPTDLLPCRNAIQGTFGALRCSSRGPAREDPMATGTVSATAPRSVRAAASWTPPPVSATAPRSVRAAASWSRPPASGRRASQCRYPRR